MKNFILGFVSAVCLALIIYVGAGTYYYFNGYSEQTISQQPYEKIMTCAVEKTTKEEFLIMKAAHEKRQQSRDAQFTELLRMVDCGLNYDNLLKAIKNSEQTATTTKAVKEMSADYIRRVRKKFE